MKSILIALMLSTPVAMAGVQDLDGDDYGLCYEILPTGELFLEDIRQVVSQSNCEGKVENGLYMGAIFVPADVKLISP